MSAMRWLEAVSLGVGWTAFVLVMFSSGSSRGALGSQRLHSARVQLADGSSAPMQPTRFMLRVPVLSSAGTPDAAPHHGHHSKQTRAVAAERIPESLIMKMATVGAGRTVGAMHRSLPNRVESQSSRNFKKPPTTDGSYLAHRRQLAEFAFLQVAEPNVVIVTLVVTCVILILIIIATLSYFALSKRSFHRRGVTQDTEKPYGSSKALWNQ